MSFWRQSLVAIITEPYPTKVILLPYILMLAVQDDIRLLAIDFGLLSPLWTQTHFRLLQIRVIVPLGTSSPARVTK